MDLSTAARAFGLEGDAAPLLGGTRTVFRVGDAVLKQIHDTSLENHHSRELAAWIAGIFTSLEPLGFRVPRPIAASDGGWIIADGWTASTVLAGAHAGNEDIPACIDAIGAFHRALADVPKHPLLDASTTPWATAHRHCFGDRPAAVHPRVAPYVDRLYRLREPVGRLTAQLIHGDLNPENILVDPGQPPGFIDMSPFWAPPEFALALFANWIGPRRGDTVVLRHFAGVPDFDQLLVRAAIRMLLVMSDLGDLNDWETCPERRAAEIVIRHVESSAR